MEGTAVLQASHRFVGKHEGQAESTDTGTRPEPRAARMHHTSLVPLFPYWDGEGEQLMWVK